VWPLPAAVCVCVCRRHRRRRLVDRSCARKLLRILLVLHCPPPFYVRFDGRQRTLFRVYVRFTRTFERRSRRRPSEPHVTKSPSHVLSPFFSRYYRLSLFVFDYSCRRIRRTDITDRVSLRTARSVCVHRRHDRFAPRGRRRRRRRRPASAIPDDTRYYDPCNRPQ